MLFTLRNEEVMKRKKDYTSLYLGSKITNWNTQIQNPCIFRFPILQTTMHQTWVTYFPIISVGNRSWPFYKKACCLIYRAVQLTIVHDESILICTTKRLILRKVMKIMECCYRRLVSLCNFRLSIRCNNKYLTHNFLLLPWDTSNYHIFLNIFILNSIFIHIEIT